MAEQKQRIDWRRTTFEGSRNEQFLRAQAMSELAELSDRLQVMPRRQNAR